MEKRLVKKLKNGLRKLYNKNNNNMGKLNQELQLTLFCFKQRGL